MLIEQHFPEPLDLASHLKWIVCYGRQQKSVRCVQALYRKLLFLIFNRHPVDTASGRFSGSSKPHGCARERLQFERYVLQDVTHPSAGAKPLKEAATFANRTAVFDHARQPLHESVVEAGKRVGGMVFEMTEVNPHF